MRRGMTAAKLRIVLVSVILLVAVLAVAGFWFTQMKLSEYAAQISALNASAQSGDDNILALQTLQRRLDEEADTIEKARAIVAQSQQYKYQDQIIEDIDRIAKRNDVKVTQFNFGGGEAQAGATAAAPVPTQVTPQPTTSGVKSEKVTVAIRSPLSYKALMNFIKAIERNPLKMQIANISITRDQGSVTSEDFTIEVYVR